MMMLTECLVWMSSVGWSGWLMPLGMLLLLGLLIAVLIKFLFFRGNAIKGDRS